MDATITDLTAYRADRLTRIQAEERVLACLAAAEDREFAEQVAEMRALRLEMTGARS